MRWLIGIRKKKRGFTLIELMIVVIIVGILAAAAIPIYRIFVKRAYETEAKASLGAIRSAELVYHAEYNTFLAVAAGKIENPPVAPSATAAEKAEAGLGVEVVKNTWFDDPACFTVTAGAGTIEDTFLAKCDGGLAGHPEVEDIGLSLNEKGVWGTFPATPVP